MALVCEIKSDNTQPLPQEQIKDEVASQVNDDLEDGEIEDDEEEIPEPAAPETETTPEATLPQTPNTNPVTKSNTTESKFNFTRNTRFDRTDRHTRYEERKRGHLTEAEKSVMHLHKLERLERLEREKRERYKREQATVVDDFASNIEKAIANVLKKDKKGSETDKEDDEKRGKKRKKRDKDKDRKKLKQRKGDSPKPENAEENEINVQSGSPDAPLGSKDNTRSPTPHSDYDSYESSSSSDRSREDRKDRKREKRRRSRSRNRDRTRNDKKRAREQKTENQYKDGQGLCLFYLQGKCTKGNECPFSHEVSHPLKLELCKFYLMECCAKGDKCLYMHSDFPCKFYHTGLPCYAGDNCKFAHGKPLEDAHRQILFKHIETAPKEILGDFPRLSRDGALMMINQAQKALEVKYGVDKNAINTNELANDKNLIPSLFELNIPIPAEFLQKDESKPKEKSEKRSRPSRWQDADPSETAIAVQDPKQQLPLSFGLTGFYSERANDQDMRTNSNGDIDMRTLPPQLGVPQLATPLLALSQDNKTEPDLNTFLTGKDVDIRTIPQDTDIRQLHLENQIGLSKDTDIRQIPKFAATETQSGDTSVEESDLKTIETKDDSPIKEKTADLPVTLPKKQRELFLRIQAQQKENVPENQKEQSDEECNNINWYSDDDDDECRLTIGDDIEESKSKSDEIEEPAHSLPQIVPIKPVEVIEKLGDLSKIDISAEVTKLLSSINQASLKETKTTHLKDPRTAAQSTDVPKTTLPSSDPRQTRLASTENKQSPKLSIYEQGSLSLELKTKDIDLRKLEGDLDLRPMFGDTDLRSGTSQGRPDVDLRQLSLPFKAMPNYTPACEIDASIKSHGPIQWHVHLVDIPRPNYTGLKLSSHEAQNTGDPRLRKIFRLGSTEEKDSPTSPKENLKESPKTIGIRVDPRRRKLEEKLPDNAQLNYSQQLNILQTSVFYQSLTSNQKVLLNQELASKTDHSGSNDPTLNGILSNLGLIPGPSTLLPNINTSANASALNILANVNNMNPSMLGQASGLMVPNHAMLNQTQNPAFLNQQVNPNVVNQMTQALVQPGLLGSAPGIPNMPNLPPNLQLNFDPRQGGLLGNAPPFNYNDNSNFNYNEEYYEEGNNYGEASGSGGRGGRGGRGGFRDRQQRRGRNFSGRSSSGRSFRNRNRTNRSRTPP